MYTNRQFLIIPTSELSKVDFDQIQETLNDFHEKNLELHNFLSYNFEDLSSTLLENLHYYNTSI